MAFFDALNIKNINNEQVISNWDSREMCRLHLLNTNLSLVYEIQNFIEKQDNYLLYEKCFLNHVFLSEIAYCFYKDKNYNKCEFEINNIFQCMEMLKRGNFKKCTFYIADYERNVAAFDLFNYEAIEDKLNSNGNKIIKSSYIEYLAKKHTNNLTTVDSKLLAGISINNTNLKDVILPKNEDFFDSLAINEINNVTLPNIDFNNYSFKHCRFSDVNFHKETTFSKEVLSKSIFSSTLPKIDFNSFDEEDFYTFGFYDCTFHNDTTFPMDKDFFLKCSIRNCFLPSFDYSFYNINGQSFNKCAFGEDAILPESLFTNQGAPALNSISKLPSKYLELFVKIGTISNPSQFLKKNFKDLSPNATFMLCKKYNIN